MAIKLNQNSPRPAITEQLISLGLNFSSSYVVQWSKTFTGEWDIKDCKTKEVVVTLQAWKVDSLIKNRVLIAQSFLGKS